MRSECRQPGNPWLAALGLLLLLPGCAEGGPLVPGGNVAKTASTPVPVWVRPLCSADEAERFRVLEQAKTEFGVLRPEHLASALDDPACANWSTLLFAGMKAHSLVVHQVDDATLARIAERKGAFPNLATWLAEADPVQGWPRLKALLGTHPDQAMAIMKAMGMTGQPESETFLIESCRKSKAAGKSIIDPLAGLASARRDLAFSSLRPLLDLPLDREETLLLAKCPTTLDEPTFKALLAGGPPGSLYATEKLLRDPGAHAGIIIGRLEAMLAARRFDEARLLLHSDALRGVSSADLRARLDAIAERIPENP